MLQAAQCTNVNVIPSIIVRVSWVACIKTPNMRGNMSVGDRPETESENEVPFHVKCPKEKLLESMECTELMYNMPSSLFGPCTG